MKFVTSYGPLVIIWICAAIILNSTLYKKNEKAANYFPEGMCIGLVLGNLIAVILDTDYIISSSLGFIIGMTFGMLIKRK